MPGPKPVLFLDTCIWIMREKSDTYTTEEVEGVREIFRMFDHNEVILATSAITYTEAYFIDEPTFGYLKSLRGNRNFQPIGIDSKVSEVAGYIRKNYTVTRIDGEGKPKTLSVLTPDAIQLAAAFVYQIEKFITVDKKDKMKLDSRGLLPLKSIGKGGRQVELHSPASMYNPVEPLQQSMKFIPEDNEEVEGNESGSSKIGV